MSEAIQTEPQTNRPDGPLMFRTATQLGVSFPDRLIELIVMPYETEALVEHPKRPGILVRETCSRGAFDGIERRASRIRVNRDHRLERTVGRAVSFHTSRDEGLVAELRIAQTDLGDETLALAADECLDASAGFLPMPGGEHWLTRTRVRYSKCWLGHIALTPEPAYEAARVLAVRQAPEPVDGAPPPPAATPKLDAVRSWTLNDRYADLLSDRPAG
jgi:HK97 family phage prohead protease